MTDRDNYRIYKCRSPQNPFIDAERTARGIHFGFQGDLNPIVADDLLPKVFILQQQGNKNYDANAPPVDMAQKGKFRVFVWLLLVAAALLAYPGCVRNNPYNR